MTLPTNKTIDFELEAARERCGSAAIAARHSGACVAAHGVVSRAQRTSWRAGDWVRCGGDGTRMGAKLGSVLGS